jgi:hypothetical protein
MWFPHIATDFVFVLDMVILYFLAIMFKWWPVPYQGDNKILIKSSKGISGPTLNKATYVNYFVFNPSAWGHLNPSSYCDVGRLFYGVFKLWSKLKRKK